MTTEEHSKVTVNSSKECAVCHRPYRGREPKILPCFHTFCLSCLHALQRQPALENNLATSIPVNSEENVSDLVIKCPTCGKLLLVPAGGVSCFQSNFYVDDNNEMSLDDREACVFCEGSQKAEYCCQDCTTNFCPECRETHDMICPERDVIPISSILHSKTSEVTGSAKDQIKVLEAVLARLDDEEREVELQKQALDDDIRARYEVGLNHLQEARDECVTGLTAKAKAALEKLQRERTFVRNVHARLTRQEPDECDIEQHDVSRTDPQGTLLSDKEFSYFKHRASKLRQPLFFGYLAGRTTVPYLRDFFRDYMGRVTSAGLYTHNTERPDVDFILQPFAEDGTSAVPPQRADENVHLRKHVIDLSARVAVLIDKIQQCQIGPAAFNLQPSVRQMSPHSHQPFMYVSAHTPPQLGQPLVYLRTDIAGTQHVLGGPQHMLTTPQHVLGGPQHALVGPQHVLGGPQHILAAPQHVLGSPLQSAAPQHAISCPQHILAAPQHAFGGPLQSAAPQHGFSSPLQLVMPQHITEGPHQAAAQTHGLFDPQRIATPPNSSSSQDKLRVSSPQSSTKEPLARMPRTSTPPGLPSQAHVLEQAAQATFTGLASEPVTSGIESLTYPMLASASPQEQKQMLGERLYPLVQRTHPELAAKVTGMLLEMDNTVLLHLLGSHESLKTKVEEAVAILTAMQAKESAAAAAAAWAKGD